jgi:glycosyltransferase involved in cell wall biosynthesis
MYLSETPKIIIVGNFLDKKITGTQRYAIEMTKALIKSRSYIRVLMTKETQSPSWLPEDSKLYFPSLGSSRFSKFISFWLIAPLYVHWIYRNANYLVWSPCNVGSPLFFKHIVTIHDMAIRENPFWFKPLFIYFYRCCFSIFNFQRIPVVTVSQFSAGEIMFYYPRLASTVCVIPNGANELSYERLKRPTNIPPSGNFILSVASKDPRKNLDFVRSSWLSLTRAKDDYLILVGASNKVFTLNEAEDQTCNGIIDLGYVSDQELAWLYRYSRAVVLASSYEGYGLPIVEAVLSGGFVICSDIPAFREVAGNLAWYYQLGDRAGLIWAMHRALNEKPVPRIIPRYQSWDTVAAKFYSHTKSLIFINCGTVI